MNREPKLETLEDLARLLNRKPKEERVAIVGRLLSDHVISESDADLLLVESPSESN